MLDSNDKEKTMYPNTPTFIMGLNEKNPTQMELGSIEYICIKGPQNHWNSQELGMRYHTKSRNVHDEQVISLRQKPMYRSLVKRIKNNEIMKVRLKLLGKNKKNCHCKKNR